MINSKRCIPLLLLLLPACMQPPAPVALRGQESFTKSGSSQSGKYAADYSGYQEVDNSAVVADYSGLNAGFVSVQENDLAPPVIKNKPFRK